MGTVVRPDGQAASAAVEKPSQKTNFGLGLCLVLASCAVLYVTFALCWGKFSRAEVFFAECAREMIAQNNMVTPLYHNRPFFDKPILVYWLIVSAFKAFGITHFVARVPSIVAGLVSVALTAFATRAIAPSNKDRAALLSAMMVGSSFMFFSFCYLCMSDMFLVMFDICTLMFLYAGTENEKKRDLLWWLASVSMGFAFVTKGPIGIVLPAISFLAYLGITARLKLIKFTHVLFGGITAALIAVPWFYAAYKANGTWALAYFFIRENFQRYAGSTYDTHKPIWFMVQSLLQGFLPWSLLLPPVVVQFKDDIKSKFATPASRNRLYLWLWTVTVTAFFSLSRGKCDYYVLPVYPTVAAIVAMYLADQKEGFAQKALLTVTALFAIGGVASPLLFAALTGNAHASTYWLTPAALVVTGAAGFWFAKRKELFASVAAVFLAICVSASGFAAQLFPSLERSQSFDVYSTAMKNTPADTKVGVSMDLGHWLDELTFQVERDPAELTDAKSIKDFFAGGPAIGLMTDAQYNDALAQYPTLQSAGLRVIDKRTVASHPLTPGYVLKRKGNLFDKTLVLVTNR